MGRADHALNRNGLLVHLGEIEGMLARVPGVAQTAAVQVGHTRRGAGIMAFVTLTRAGTLSDEDILARCRAELAAHAVPDALTILTEMPMLASGKVDRRRLTDLARERLAAGLSTGITLENQAGQDPAGGTA
jgi:acyl-coenzyme A synthetase/AMP-(fatty) acid ligase